MKQAKKIFTRMCLNNWGGIDHKVLEFNEYVNLFSGKSGSGKSTVMDAIQVILYGSLSSNFLNKAADDSKNKRSVLGYLRGEQKDGSANRAGKDFCTTIVLEIEDTGTHTFTCVGMAAEIKKNDTEIKKYIYFSHSGRMPEDGYVSSSGSPYTNKEIKNLIETRKASKDNRGRVDINRSYPSKEAYLAMLYDGILGYIDGNRFVTMEKSAIALKMTNGTGQFIKDYMFPKNSSDVIEKISDQLGTYREITEKIKELKKKIDLLEDVRAAGLRKQETSIAIFENNRLIRCIEIEELKEKIAVEKERIAWLEEELKSAYNKENTLNGRFSEVEEELIKVSADLVASDLGRKEEQLLELQKRSRLLKEDSEQWRRVVRGLKCWQEDEILADYISNVFVHQIDDFCKGKVTIEQCEELKASLKSEQKNVEELLEEYREQERELGKQISELRIQIEDMENGRKTYPKILNEAKSALEHRLTDCFRKKIKVSVLADLFDVTDKEWKDAIEGRMGKLKFSLVTEPQYAHEAAVVFRSMKRFEMVDLINTKAIEENGRDPVSNSLYEAVKTEFPYVDKCLQHYLGHIEKCRSVEELEQVREGVTPDCYSYSNFIFRHLKKDDYTKNACIGSKVSKEKLAEYRMELEKLEIRYTALCQTISGLKATREFESLNNEPAYFVRLSKALGQLEDILEEMEELREAIRMLKEGPYKELEEKQRLLTEKKNEILQEQHKIREAITRYEGDKRSLTTDVSNHEKSLSEKKMGYVSNEKIESEVKEILKNHSGQSVKRKKEKELGELIEREQAENEELYLIRNRFNAVYPTFGFSGMEKTNEPYEKLLNDYRSNYEPKYQKEFEEQCNFIYKSLRENVIATIHGDINAAKRHTHAINRLLRETNFSDSIYQIKIEPAKNENGQFYEMLTASELDTKNVDNNGFEGQLSFGEDAFYQKYEQKIKLLMEKFMPVKEGEEHKREARIREMEQFADYRNYLSFSMFEQVSDEDGNVIRENFVDEMAGRDSGGEGQNPKYVALLAGFAMLYMQQSNRDSKIKLVLLDEAFSKMDQERSAVCLNYARQMDLQLIVCVPDERLHSLIRNVDCVYGFRRFNNQISMMHIDKGDYLKLVEGEE